MAKRNGGAENGMVEKKPKEKAVVHGERRS